MKVIELEKIENDGLTIPEVGRWSERKLRHVAHYVTMFATSMKNKWDARVYIDLFAGAGFNKIRDTDKIIAGSPLLALNTPDQFDRYIFCEECGEKINALRIRADRYFPEADVRYLQGDTNQLIKSIRRSIPSHSQTYHVISFCLVDPFKISNLNFATIRALSHLIIDFLVLIPSFCDANRNQALYSMPDQSQIDEFLGRCDWRTHWDDNRNGYKFGNFLALEFIKSMHEIGYLGKPEDLVTVRNPETNSPLYHLAFFSSKELGVRFWRETKKNVNAQMDLFA